MNKITEKEKILDQLLDNKDQLNIKNLDENQNNILQKDLIISEEKIKKITLQQNKEIFKIKQRINIEIEKSKKFSLEKFITEFLPIIDNIEYASNLLKKREEKIYCEIFKNVEDILSLIKNILIDFKISKINKINVLFNPDIHQAMSIKYTDEIQSNKIIEVMQSGYIIDNIRLLRPAMVVVSKNK